MAQKQYTISIADQATADQIIANTENIAGVRFVNINIAGGTIVVTHGDDFDEEAFKAAAGI